MDEDAGGDDPGSVSISWWHVYIVRCADGTLYTGVTNDVPARVAEHNLGRGAKYTRARRPVQLVYVERAVGRAAAQRREHQIKRLPRTDKHRLIAAGVPAVPRCTLDDAIVTSATAKPG